MQKIIEKTREKLIPYIGEPTFEFTAPPEPHLGRFVHKIPQQNYEKLGRFVPISWL